MRARDPEGDLIEPRDVLDEAEGRAYADRQRLTGPRGIKHVAASTDNSHEGDQP